MKIKLMKREYEERQLKWSIEYLCVELPQCNIAPDTPLSQNVKIIVARAKDLEETIEKMDVAHKACIIELDARVPRMLPEECKAQVAELQGCAETIETRLVKTQKFLNEATKMWRTMEEIDGLIKVYEALQKNQKELDELIATMKDLILLQCMLKIRESNKLQTELHKL